MDGAGRTAAVKFRREERVQVGYTSPAIDQFDIHVWLAQLCCT